MLRVRNSTRFALFQSCRFSSAESIARTPSSTCCAESGFAPLTAVRLVYPGESHKLVARFKGS